MKNPFAGLFGKKNQSIDEQLQTTEDIANPTINDINNSENQSSPEVSTAQPSISPLESNSEIVSDTDSEPNTVE